MTLLFFSSNLIKTLFKTCFLNCCMLYLVSGEATELVSIMQNKFILISSLTEYPDITNMCMLKLKHVHVVLHRF